MLPNIVQCYEALSSDISELEEGAIKMRDAGSVYRSKHITTIFVKEGVLSQQRNLKLEEKMLRKMLLIAGLECGRPDDSNCNVQQ